MRRLASLVAVAVVPLLAGCTSPPHGTEQLLVATSTPSGPTGPAPGGTLDYDAGGCVSLNGDLVLVAPPGSRLIDDGIILLPPLGAGTRGRQLQVSESMPKGVEGVLVDRRSPLVPRGADCGADRYFVLE